MVVLKKGKRPFVLGSRGVEILKAMHFYRYMTALDVCHLLYSPGSLTLARSVLAGLCGGADFIGNQYLYRFRLPDVEMGREKVYALGARGRGFLESELGISSSWYFRPEKVRHLSYGQIMHSLVLTRFLVATQRWAAESKGEFRTAQVRICYDLAGAPGSVSIGEGDKRETLPVIPDGWIAFERLKAGGRVTIPVLLEVDRGTMYRQRFKRHVESRIRFVRGEGYEKMFGVKAVMIVYAAVGSRVEDGESRRRSLAAWTMEVLEEMGLLKAGGSFRFCGLSYGEIYRQPPFGRDVWYRPDQKSPVGLL